MMTMDDIRAVAEEVEDHYQTVTDESEANFKHAEFKDYPSDIRGNYRRDVERMDKYYDKFLGVLEMIEKKGIDEKRVNLLQDMLDSFYNAIETVQASNGMFKAFLDEGVAGKAAGMFELLSLLVKGQRKTVETLIEDIQDIEKLLEKAKKDVSNVQIQKGFNLALTAVSLCFPQLRVARAVFVALGTAGAKVMVDEFLGPTGPSIAGGIKTATFDYLGIAEEVGKVGNTVATVYSTIDTYVTDEAELGKAEKTVRTVKKKLEDTKKALAQFQRLVKDSEKTLVALGIGLDKSVAAAHKARDAYASQKLERAELVAEAG